MEALSNIDDDQFRLLTQQESFSVKGQVAKMEMVEECIRRRVRRDVTFEEIKLQQQGRSEEEAEAMVKSTYQFPHIQHFILKDTRFNLIVGKGSGKDARYTVMIPAHIDTFGLDPEAPKDMLTLWKDPLEPDRCRGHGVWDMGAAVLNSIALAASVRVPEGMHVYFVFTVDEESDSIGARELIQRWPEWKDVDLVLSSEIGPLSVPPAEGDTLMRYILARRGRRKLSVTVSIDEEFQGHGGVDALPNAREAHTEWEWYAKRRFYEQVMVSGVLHQPFQKTHPLFPMGEKFSPGGIISDFPGGQANPSLVESHLFIQIVPPTSLAEALEAQRQVFREIADIGTWAQYGIQHALVEHTATSYESYDMPLFPDGSPKPHLAVDAVRDVLQDVSGQEPVAAGALSNADECLYAASLLERTPHHTFDGTRKGVITIPIIGNKAHNVKEWVSWSDIGRVRQAMRQLIESDMGLRRLLISE